MVLSAGGSIRNREVLKEHRGTRTVKDSFILYRNEKKLRSDSVRGRTKR